MELYFVWPYVNRIFATEKKTTHLLQQPRGIEKKNEREKNPRSFIENTKCSSDVIAS